MRNPSWSFAAGAVVVLTSASASATEFAPSFGVSRAAAVVDIWPAKNSFAMLNSAELQLRLSPGVFLDASISGAYASIGGGLVGTTLKQATLGNPTIGMHFAASPSRNFHFFVGGGVTIPVLHDPSAEMADVAIFTSPIRGYYDADRLAPGHVALRAAGGIEWRMADPLFLRAEVRPVVYIPTNDKYRAFGSSGDATEGRRQPGFAIEHAAELELRFDMGLGFGMRLQGVAPLMEDDQYQALAEPFIGITPPQEDGFFARVGLPTALDQHLGFGLDENKLAGVKVTVGGQW